MTYPCTTGLCHLAFDLFRGNDYVNNGNVVMKCWCLQCFTWTSHNMGAGGERKRFLKTAIVKHLSMISWYTNSTRTEGRFWNSNKRLTRTTTVHAIQQLFQLVYVCLMNKGIKYLVCNHLTLLFSVSPCVVLNLWNKLIQSSAIITRSNITRHFIKHCVDWNRI